jgi:hypothetical protein
MTIIRSLAAGKSSNERLSPIADALLLNPAYFRSKSTSAREGWFRRQQRPAARHVFRLPSLETGGELGGATARRTANQHFTARGPVLIVLSGGNVDAEMFSRAIARTPPA